VRKEVSKTKSGSTSQLKALETRRTQGSTPTA
jgi:hypothetical protein